MRLQRPWTAGPRLSSPTLERHGTGPAVLIHHGFLLDFNAIWHRSGLVGRLTSHGLDAVLVTEHFLREAGDAHAFGHDAIVLLAETLAAAIDVLGAPVVSIVAEGSGTAPALVAAANDDRIRRLVLVNPAFTASGADTPAVGLAEPPGPTAAEVDLGLPCAHHDWQPLAPVPGLRLDLGAVSAPTLIVASAARRPTARALAGALPQAVHTEAGDLLTTPDPRFADRVIEFLARPD